MKKYYITTAIAYTSGKPHIGNIYDPLFATFICEIFISIFSSNPISIPIFVRYDSI